MATVLEQFVLLPPTLIHPLINRYFARVAKNYTG